MTDDNIITVSELNNYIKKIIDAEELLYNISVVGEVSSFSLSQNTAYFCLKEGDCILNCVMFNCLKHFKLGDKVVVNGTPRFYPKGGKLNLNVTKIELYGLGELYQQFLDLKEKLSKEGLFDQKNKKPIPEIINTIGIVTSKTGAVIQDIFNVVSRRNPYVKLKLYSCQVQGKDSEQTICDGINYFNNSDVDVIVVARGGGSVEDLSVFNSELIARTVFSCQKPLVSAVGHETDFTIIDFVADLRAPTPSAAAELLTKDLSIIGRDIVKHLKSLYKCMINKIVFFEDKTFANFYYYKNQITNKINEQQQKLNIISNTIDKVNPMQILKRGFSQVFKQNVKIKSVKQLQLNDRVTLSFVDGKASAKIVKDEGE